MKTIQTKQKPSSYQRSFMARSIKFAGCFVSKIGFDFFKIEKKISS